MLAGERGLAVAAGHDDIRLHGLTDPHQIAERRADMRPGKLGALLRGFALMEDYIELACNASKRGRLGIGQGIDEILLPAARFLLFLLGGAIAYLFIGGIPQSLMGGKFRLGFGTQVGPLRI